MSTENGTQLAREILNMEEHCEDTGLLRLARLKHFELQSGGCSADTAAMDADENGGKLADVVCEAVRAARRDDLTYFSSNPAASGTGTTSFAANNLTFFLWPVSRVLIWDDDNPRGPCSAVLFKTL